jgi:chromosome segregation ATPase
MIPSVRKVYIEIPSQAGLQNQIALLESRVKSLEKDKQLLMTKCESNMAASATHAEGEKKARLDADKVKKEVVNLKRKYDILKGKYSELKPKCVSCLKIVQILLLTGHAEKPESKRSILTQPHAH